MQAGHDRLRGEGKQGQKSSGNQFPLPTIPSPPGSSVSSLSSQQSIIAHVHPPTPDMDDSREGYTRRRAASNVDQNGRPYAKPGMKTDPRQHRRRDLESNDDEAGGKPAAYSLEDRHSSDFSSLPTSEDLEMEHYPSDGSNSDEEEARLARMDKQRGKRRRPRTATSNGGPPGSIKTAKQEQKLADKDVARALIINALLIASWYFFSVSISVYNRWMFSPGNLDFHFPLFTTCMHMVVQFLLASLVLYFLPHFRPRNDSITNPHNNSRTHEGPLQSEKPLMTKIFYLTRIGPCGAATGLDIGLGNMSLKFITLTFFTMCKSSALAFILLFAFLFRLETPSVKLVLIIATMTVGVIMMVAGETEFNALGFGLIISASFFSGFRWALTQILLLRNPATSNPFSSIFFLAPIMFLSLAILAIPVEGFVPLGAGLNILTKEKGAFEGIGILLFPGVLAFLMTASEFALLKRTSVVTLSICGIFKEVVTISAANVIFDDQLTPINVSGLLITIGAIAAYNYIKITKMRKEARAEVEKREAMEGEAAQPMLGAQLGNREDLREEFDDERANSLRDESLAKRSQHHE